jgi:hypothetical protein
VSMVVEFIIKNIDKLILFTCLVGYLNSSLVEIKKNIMAQSLKNCLGCLNYWAGVNTSMQVPLRVRL